MYFHRGTVCLAVGVLVDNGMADDVCSSGNQFARVLADITSVLVGIPFGKHGSSRAVAAYIAACVEPVAVLAVGRC